MKPWRRTSISRARYGGESAPSPETGAGEHPQDFQHHAARRGGWHGPDLVTAIGAMQWRAPHRPVLREIFGTDQPTVRLHPRGQRPRDLAVVKARHRIVAERAQ